MHENNNSTWFCQECQTMMEHHDGFDKCPICGAEAWPSGEAHYQQDAPKAELGVKMHGRWYCQRCRVPMIPINDEYCKCPSCTAEVWYGRIVASTSMEKLRMMMEDSEDDEQGSSLIGRAVHGNGKGHKHCRKKDMSKPTTERLYKQLFSDGA